MADWPRTLSPTRSTDLTLPGPLISVSQSGKVNTRDRTQVGHRWMEEYTIRYDRAADKEVVAAARNFWRNGTTFNITHLAYLTPLGSARDTDNTEVNGSGQTGSSISCNSAPTSQTNYLRAGDLVKFPGVTLIYEVTADCNTDGSGNVTVPINPPIYEGGEPTDNQDLTFENLTFQCVIPEPPEFPEIGPGPLMFGTLRVHFMETP